MGSSTSKEFLNKRLDGKTVVITGCNTGIGKATAKVFYRLGARVIMACRDIKRAENAATDIQTELCNEESVGKFIIKELDLSSFASIRKCAEDINNNEDKLHILINNAGVMMCPQGKTEDGFEIHFGVNYLGHFLFTNILLKKIIKSSPARIVNVSSVFRNVGVIHWDDINWEKMRYSAVGAYAQSKLANVLFTIELANKLKDTGVTTYSVNPGVVKTELLRHVNETYFTGMRWIAEIGFHLSTVYKTPEKGALPILYCALKDSDNFSGCYYNDLREEGESLENKYGESSKKLWDLSSNLVNYDFNTNDAAES